MLRLVKFEVSESCTLSPEQVKAIRESIEQNIRRVNHTIARGADRYTSAVIDRRDSERHGMQIVCACAGIDVETEYEEQLEESR